MILVRVRCFAYRFGSEEKLGERWSERYRIKEIMELFIVRGAPSDPSSNDNALRSPWFPLAPLKRVKGPRDERGSIPRRSGVVKVAFDPEGLPISHLPLEGDSGRQAGRGCQGSATHTHTIYIYWTKFRDLLSSRKGNRTRERGERGIAGMRLEFQRAGPFLGLKREREFAWKAKDTGQSRDKGGSHE